MSSFDLAINDDALLALCPTIRALHFHQFTEGIWRSRGPSFVGRVRGLLGFRRFLGLAKRVGLRILWTVHDIHNYDSFDCVDRWGYRLLAHRADLLICHDEHTRNEFHRRCGGRLDQTVVMPIGNYDGTLPPPGPRELTLARLGLSASARTLVCFGNVFRHKGIDLAIEAVRRLGSAYQFIAAGRPLDAGLGRELSDRAKGMKNVRLLLERVDDQTAADLLHAADCVLLPYRSITGSSALLTAFSMSRGVVVSDLPFFRGLLEHEPRAGELFTAGDVNGVAEAVARFFVVPLGERRAAARRLADRYAWDNVVAPVAARIYESLGERPHSRYMQTVAAAPNEHPNHEP